MADSRFKRKEKIYRVFCIVLAFLFIYLIGSDNPKANTILDILRPFLIAFAIYLYLKDINKNKSKVSKLFEWLIIVFFTILFIISLVDFANRIKSIIG